MHSLNTINYLNSAEYQNNKKQVTPENKLKTYQLQKFEDVNLKQIDISVENEQLKLQLIELKNKMAKFKYRLIELKNKYENGLIDRLDEIIDVNNTLPKGINIAICETDLESPKVDGILTDETKKFYIINGKRYHKQYLKFCCIIDDKVVLEDTKW